MAHPGFLDWATSIRITMANDPGRQIFQDQIQVHGFLFLENYLENILAGPKQDPIIELVKTPGRKRAKKKNATASKLKNVITLSSKDDVEKENIPLVNGFYHALLQAKKDDGPHSLPLSTLALAPIPNSEEEVQPAIAPDSAFLAPSHPEQTELSVIAEGDESAECSIQLTHRGLPTVASNSSATQTTPSLLRGQRGTGNLFMTSRTSEHTRNSSNQNLSTSSLADSFHSVPLDSPKGSQPLPKTPHENNTPALPDLKHCNAFSNPPSKTISVPQSSIKRPENITAPLPEIPPWQPPIVRSNEAVTAPLPSLTPTFPANSSPPPTTIIVPLRDPPPPSPKGLTRKASASLFPILPAPLPLRKSIRVTREPSTGIAVGATGHTTPGAAVGGKRSSWLIKAREAKAMEDTSKTGSALGVGFGGTFNAFTGTTTVAAVPGILGALKRKSGDMLGISGQHEDERQHKSAKVLDGDIAPTKLTAKYVEKGKEREHGDQNNTNLQHQLSPQFSVPIPPQPLYQNPEVLPINEDQDRILDRLKKTVEGLGARVGKSMGKSIGGAAAASLLAEARAAAKARVVEREMAAVSVEPVTHTPSVEKEGKDVARPPSPHSSGHPRLSLSDLSMPNEQKMVNSGELPPNVLAPASSRVHTSSTEIAQVGSQSTSATPPNSPPQSRLAAFALPPIPVFNKPPPVFVPPSPQSRAKDFSFKLPPSTTFSLPAPMSLGRAARRDSPSLFAQPRQPVALSAQSTIESIASDGIFETHEDVPAWMPTTQDTEYSSVLGSQPTALGSQYQYVNDLDDDDSWPLDEKLPEGTLWVFGGAAADDSYSWSSTASQKVETRPLESIRIPEAEPHMLPPSSVIPGTSDTNADQSYEEAYLGLDESELEEMAVEAGISTVNLVEPKTSSRSESQLSMASSSSSNTGFLSQAGKLVSSVLGTNKKAKTEVKSLQLAAVAAKKQQEEMDKKAARLKEMENRRQLALQRKADEERARTIEQDRKLKEEGERRKREREEHTDKRPIKAAAKKEEEEVTKKRKLVVEIEKKPAKKTAKITKAGNSTKQAATLKQPAVHNAPQQAATASSSTSKTTDTKVSRTPATSSTMAKTTANGKTKVILNVPDDESIDPSHVVHTQMAARVKARMQAAKRAAAEPEVRSESIELPDINSEYSDSDSDQPRTFDPPGWAQSPELRQALQMQSTVNPDEIFGAIRPLKMEEMFRARTSRFRARTSSANWAGADRLTIEEEREYVRRMGFR